MNEIRYWIETEGTGHWFFYAFPVILLCLFIWFKGRRVRFLIPSLLISLVIINPWFYRKWDELGLYAYWRILWVVPAIPVVAVLIPSITERVGKTWIKAVVAAAGVSLIVLGGTFLYNGAGGSFVEAANAAKLPDYVVQIADRLLELDDHPRVVVQDPIGVYIRQYTGKIDTLYGRDLHGYIADMIPLAKDVNRSLNSGNLDAVNQMMLDNGFDYLVFNGDAGDGFELIDTVDRYGVFKVIGFPNVLIERNDFGQIITITTVDELGEPRNNELGYASLYREYDTYNNVTRYWYTDDAEKRIVNNAGYSIVEQKSDTSGNLLSREYLDSDGYPVLRSDGYSKTIWSQDDNDTWNVKFLDSHGNDVPIEGINLINNIETDSDGWSAWMTPEYGVENYCFNIGNANLGIKQAGDIYTCYVEIEFKDVSAYNDDFWFRSQGCVDNSWNIYNPWNNFVSVTNVPQDGLYTFQVSYVLTENMAKASNYEIGFRCDNWSSGSFRVHNVKIEKGNNKSEWSPGV